jgi:hypothetical protein
MRTATKSSDPLTAYLTLAHMLPRDRLEVLKDEEHEAWQIPANTQVSLAICGSLGINSLSCARALAGLSIGVCYELSYGAMTRRPMDRERFLLREAPRYRER